jgi:predicted RNA binding protein with dsRBD fold (UPF0201 family)
MIEKAILKINPNAEFTMNADDINQITWLNGTTPISVADIQEQLPIVEQEIADEAQAKIDNKASANTKLKALGLTDAEIEALKN